MDPQLAVTVQDRSSSRLPKSPPNDDKEGRSQVSEDKKKEVRRSQEEEGRGERSLSRKLKNITVDIGIREFASFETYRGCRDAGQAGRSKKSSTSSCEASSLSTLSQKSPGSSISSVELVRRSPSACRRTPSPANGQLCRILSANTCRCASQLSGNTKTTELATAYWGGTGTTKLEGKLCIPFDSHPKIFAIS